MDSKEKDDDSPQCTPRGCSKLCELELAEQKIVARSNIFHGNNNTDLQRFASDKVVGGWKCPWRYFPTQEWKAKTGLTPAKI